MVLVDIVLNNLVLSWKSNTVFLWEELIVLILWSQSSVITVGYEFTRITYFWILKRSHGFSCWWCTFQFLLPWVCVMPICWLPHGCWFTIVGPEFIPHDKLWWETSCPVLYCFQRSWGLLYLPFFVHITTFITLMTTDLGMDILFSNYHYTAFTVRLGGG
jgi:hypothetical protein